jgi:predicted metalloprotease with PDZ domain
MFSHPEYDDKYWRYLDHVTADGGVITHDSGAVWHVMNASRDLTIHYRLVLPPWSGTQRQAWKPFLTRTGGFVDAPHGLLYIVGAERGPSDVRFILPTGWRVATPLPGDSNRYRARNVADLMDGPFLLGRLREWDFQAAHTPHRVFYWDAPDAKAFDTTQFVAHIGEVVSQAAALFGGLPYARYTFLYVDQAYGALEHPDAVTLGAPSADLASDPDALLEETAHEYFHLWNLMRIKPAGYGGVTYEPRPLSTGLWVSEGFTMFYADLLARRAGLRLRDSTRTRHLERLLARYLENPVFAHYSAERISQSSYASDPLFLGDYQGSTHLNGEIIGAMLDILIRSRTDGRRSLDDVMRGLAKDTTGFTTAGVQRLVESACGCDVGPFFDHYVRGAALIDVNQYLTLLGLRAQVDLADAVDTGGRAIPDVRIWAYQPLGAPRALLLLNTPESQWGRAGFHSGDSLITMGDSAMTDLSAFRRTIRRFRVGDTVQVTVRRAGGEFTARVPLTGYQHPFVRILPDSAVPERVRKLREAWEAGQ